MVKFLIKLLLGGLAVYVSAIVLNVLFPSMTPVVVKSYPVAIVVAVIIGVVNAIIRPILKAITLPINVITLGLFGFVVNGICMLIVPHITGYIVPGGFVIASFVWALVFSALVSFMNATMNALI